MKREPSIWHVALFDPWQVALAFIALGCFVSLAGYALASCFGV